MATVNGITYEAAQAILDGTIVSATIDGSGHLIFTHTDASTSDAGAVLGSVPNASTTLVGVVQLATNSEATTGTSTTKAVTPAGVAAVVTTINSDISNKQNADSDLTAIAGLTPAANDVMQYKGTAWANRTLTQLAADLTSSLLQPKDSDLTAIAGLTPAANDVLQFISGAWANRTMAQLLTALSGTLSAINGLTPAVNDFMQYKGTAWANRTPAQAAADLAAVGQALAYQYSGSAYVAVNTPGIYSGSADPGSVANGSIWYTTT